MSEVNRSTEKKLYRVHMRSVPGMYEQYDGYLDVYSDGQNIFMDAVRKLRSTSFPDRTADMWRMVSYEHDWLD